MIVFIPINGFLAQKNRILTVKKLRHQDLRVKMINEILAGIKVFSNLLS